MKKKTARRWLKDNRWKIGRGKCFGFTKKLYDQYVKCLCDAQQDIRFRRF